MRKPALLLPVPLLLAACGFGDEAPRGDATVDVLRYDYAFDLESREASAQVTMRFVEPGDCVAAKFRAKDIDNVQLDGKPVRDGTLSGDVLTVCGHGWREGDEVVLSADMVVPAKTWGDSQVGYSVSTDLEDAPFYYLVSWVGGCDRFGPCDPAPDRFARYHFTVTHPSGAEVLCPGTLTAGDTETVCDFDMAGGPTYSTFALMASPSWEEVDLGTWAGVDVTLYDMPSVGYADALDPDLHAGFLGWMEDHFGPYPYGDELRVAVGPTYWSGFEHPGNILLSDVLGSNPSAYEYPLAHTLNHEMAHQWAGDQTTLADTYDFVWKESMVEYLTFVYESENMPVSVGRNTAYAWESFSRYAEYFPVPEDKPALLDYYGDVYGEGPMVLFRQIEALYSRDDVLAALESLLGQERAIGVADVKQALEDATGADLDAYFDAWVYGDGQPQWPTFSVTISQESAGAPAEVTVRQESPKDQLFGGAFAIELSGDQADQSQDVWIDLGPDGAAETTVSADPGFLVTGHTFDPDFQTLAREASSSQAPAPEPPPAYLRHPWVARPQTVR